MILRHQRQHVRAAALDLHHVAHGLVEELTVSTQRKHQRPVLNEGDGAVLQLAGGIGLGVDVRDLLELQGALQTQSVVHVPTDEEHGIVVEILGCVVLDLLLLFQHLLHLGGQHQQLLHRAVIPLPRHGTQLLREIQPQQVHHRKLGGVRLGGGHGDLRPGPGVQHHIRLPGDGRTHHVDDGQDLRPQPLGLPEGGHGVQRLAGLADDHHEGIFIHDWVHVAELGGQRHLHRLAHQPLQIVLAHHAHMVGGTAGHDVDLADIFDVVLVKAEVLEVHPAVLDPGEDGPAQGLGLLHDLLEHEVLIAALFRRVDLPVNVGDLLFHRLHQVVVALDALPGEHREFPVLHVDDFPGVLDNGGNVGRQELAAVAQAQDQRAVLPGRDDAIRLISADDAQRVGALDAAEHLAHRLEDVALVEVLHKLGHHLGVRLRLEGDALIDQKFLQLRVIFDDAVVHHGDPAAPAHLRVGVDVGRRPVGGPAGVPDADLPVDGRAALNEVGQHLKPALGLGHLQLRAVKDRHARGVVPAVFQTGQPIQQDGGRLLFSDKTYNAAHMMSHETVQGACTA